MKRLVIAHKLLFVCTYTIYSHILLGGAHRPVLAAASS